MTMRTASGVVVRHRRGCASRARARCDCLPTYQAQVCDPRTGRRLSRSFETRAEAKRWRQDTAVDIRRGEIALRPSAQSVEAAMTGWLTAAKAGSVRTRGRVPYAPSTLVSLEQGYRLHVRGRFGAARLGSLTLLDVQEWVDDLQRAGMCAATIAACVLPLRLLFRWAKKHGQITVNPVDGLELPLIRRSRRKPADISARIHRSVGGGERSTVGELASGVRACRSCRGDVAAAVGPVLEAVLAVGAWLAA